MLETTLIDFIEFALEISMVFKGYCLLENIYHLSKLQVHNHMSRRNACVYAPSSMCHSAQTLFEIE